MKNWRTTLASVVACLALAAQPIAEALAGTGTIHWGQLLAAAALAAMGVHAKDARVE